MVKLRQSLCPCHACRGLGCRSTCSRAPSHSSHRSQSSNPQGHWLNSRQQQQHHHTPPTQKQLSALQQLLQKPSPSPQGAGGGVGAQQEGDANAWNEWRRQQEQQAAAAAAGQEVGGTRRQRQGRRQQQQQAQQQHQQHKMTSPPVPTQRPDMVVGQVRVCSRVCAESVLFSAGRDWSHCLCGCRNPTAVAVEQPAAMCMWLLLAHTYRRSLALCMHIIKLTTSELFCVPCCCRQHSSTPPPPTTGWA